MLSGMIAPTSGDAYIFGQSIITNMSGIRRILGVVPQHNILYDLLTVREHLELFAAIKGVPRGEVDSQIDEMIAQVGLTEKAKDKSAALSGGMKRKLRFLKKERGEKEEKGEKEKKGGKRRRKRGKKKEFRPISHLLSVSSILLFTLSPPPFSLCVQRWYRVARRFKDCLLG